jgi:hypothetical protein
MLNEQVEIFRSGLQVGIYVAYQLRTCCVYSGLYCRRQTGIFFKRDIVETCIAAADLFYTFQTAVF